MTEERTLRDALELEQVGENSFIGQNVTIGHGASVVFGGQLLSQSIMAASTISPEKYVKTIHLIFARGADPSKPLEIEVDTMAAGRAMASATVTTRQEGRLCTRALVLLTAEEPDLIRHAISMPDVGKPAASPERGGEGDFWEVRIVDDVDLMSGDVGPAELNVWSRFPGDGADGVLGQALLSYATDGFLIATAMRPHEGISQAQAHVSISTSVLSHTLTFHEPIDASRWHLLSHESPYAGRGRTYGRAHVFNEEGQLVASYVQDNMVRDFPKESRPAPGERSKF